MQSVAAKGCTVMEWQLRAALHRVAAMGCTAMGWQLRAALQGWQPRGCAAQVAAECCAVLQWWRPRAALCCNGGSQRATWHRGSRGLRSAAMVAAEGLHGIGGCQGLHRIAMVAVEGLHCTGGS